MYEKISIPEIFGINVFNDSVMRERLPKKIYNELKNTIEKGESLKSDVADIVANAMKDWAIERGATHYTHWFQPMTGITAEKHDAFLTPLGDGTAIMEFSGKTLIKGESDASSFPSGGLRTTFEARGYTAWDCTSPAFLKEDAAGITLCIPTIFCSYTGEALDKKTPLLRSIEALNIQVLRILRLFGNTTTKRTIVSVGAEQEYFLIDKDLYKKRKDIIFTGRTLFGSKPPKGQELDDHYFGNIKERVACFMRELNVELWKLGVSAKTQHNEVAPAQHELAPVYTEANMANDHNQIIMESLKRIAGHHNLVCLLHEKPFAGVNGSGKHDNWSLCTDNGQNLLDPGKTPQDNIQFLLFLVAVIKAVDVHADLLRAFAANPGNDHRLGAAEAPPAIISIFLGEQLESILKQFETGKSGKVIEDGKIQMGVSTIPVLKKDATDRNRTSPFAFTGNKFEFRMVPSSATISGPTFLINTIVADVLKEFADEIEKSDNFDNCVNDIIKRTYINHKRVIFDGNGYSEEWIEEAKKRGLPNLRYMVDAIPYITSKKSIEVFERHNVLSEVELYSRAEISYEAYINQITIEARTMIDIALKEIRPAVIDYSKILADTINSIISFGGDATVQIEILDELTENLKSFNRELKNLQKVTEESSSFSGDTQSKAIFFKDKIESAMNNLRIPADKLETIVDEKVWPFPTYGELLFNI